MRCVLLTIVGLALGLCGAAQAHDGDVQTIFNVRDYGAAGDGRSDDSAAIAAAAALAAHERLGAILFFPAGIYRLTVALPTFVTPVSLYGDGHAQSVLLIDTQFTGDVFSWSAVAPTRRDERERTGITVEGLRIVGNRTTRHIQNAFVFYDHADEIVMRNVDVFYMTGRALHAGVRQRTAAAGMTNASFDSLRFFHCGSAGIPVVDFDAQGSGATTADVTVNALDVYAPHGTGLIIHATHGTARNLRLSKLRIEGIENGAVAADLLQVGDVAQRGSVADIEFMQAELIDPYTGFSALRFAAGSLAAAPMRVRYQGNIVGGLANGGGLAVDAGRDLSLDFTAIHTSGVNVTVASSVTVGGVIRLNGFGQEHSWTRAIHPTAAQIVRKPPLEQF